MDLKINKINSVKFEIPATGKMKVPCRIYASDRLLEKMKQDRTIRQGINITHLPGIYKYAVILPDGHEGFPNKEFVWTLDGFPIGGVAALDYEKGGLSPGGIG